MHLTVIAIWISVFGCGADGKLSTKNSIGQALRFVFVQTAALADPITIETTRMDRIPQTTVFILPVLKSSTSSGALTILDEISFSEVPYRGLS